MLKQIPEVQTDGRVSFWPIRLPACVSVGSQWTSSEKEQPYLKNPHFVVMPWGSVMSIPIHSPKWFLDACLFRCIANSDVVQKISPTGGRRPPELVHLTKSRLEIRGQVGPPRNSMRVGTLKLNHHEYETIRPPPLQLAVLFRCSSTAAAIVFQRCRVVSDICAVPVHTELRGLFADLQCAGVLAGTLSRCSLSGQHQLPPLYNAALQGFHVRVNLSHLLLFKLTKDVDNVGLDASSPNGECSLKDV